jgi:hypothetical protein
MKREQKITFGEMRSGRCLSGYIANNRMLSLPAVRISGAAADSMNTQSRPMAGSWTYRLPFT